MVGRPEDSAMNERDARSLADRATKVEVWKTKHRPGNAVSGPVQLYDDHAQWVW